jgi:hypothetical protein
VNIAHPAGFLTVSSKLYGRTGIISEVKEGDSFINAPYAKRLAVRPEYNAVPNLMSSDGSPSDIATNKN